MTQSLFLSGKFKLHSGDWTNWKLDCDALSDRDILAIADTAKLMLPEYERVKSIPRGGDRLAEAMKPWTTLNSIRTLIVDDVYTTGASFREAAVEEVAPIGFVIFARTVPPSWILPMFTFSGEKV